MPESASGAAFLTNSAGARRLRPMTLLELKQQVSRLSARELRELNAYMIRLRHESPQWRRSASKRMAATDAGAKVPLTAQSSHLA